MLYGYIMFWMVCLIFCSCTLTMYTVSFYIYQSFYSKQSVFFTTQTLLSMLYVITLCLSVCIFVTKWISFDMAKGKNMQKISLDSAGTLFFWCQRCREKLNQGYQLPPPPASSSVYDVSKINLSTIKFLNTVQGRYIFSVKDY